MTSNQAAAGSYRNSVHCVVDLHFPFVTYVERLFCFVWRKTESCMHWKRNPTLFSSPSNFKVRSWIGPTMALGYINLVAQVFEIPVITTYVTYDYYYSNFFHLIWTVQSLPTANPKDQKKKKKRWNGIREDFILWNLFTRNFTDITYALWRVINEIARHIQGRSIHFGL